MSRKMNIPNHLSQYTLQQPSTKTAKISSSMILLVYIWMLRACKMILYYSQIPMPLYKDLQITKENLLPVFSLISQSTLNKAGLIL